MVDLDAIVSGLRDKRELMFLPWTPEYLRRLEQRRFGGALLLAYERVNIILGGAP